MKWRENRVVPASLFVRGQKVHDGKYVEHTGIFFIPEIDPGLAALVVKSATVDERSESKTCGYPEKR